MRHLWSYSRALFQVGKHTCTVLLAGGSMLGVGVCGLVAFALCLASADLVMLAVGSMFAVVGAYALGLGSKMLYDYFSRRPGPDPVWEWPSEIVRREERERREARKGIELIASAPPEGSGTELESSGAPEGRGTELTADEPAADRPKPPRERT